MTGFLASKLQYREYTGYQVKESNMILFFYSSDKHPHSKGETAYNALSLKSVLVIKNFFVTF